MNAVAALLFLTALITIAILLHELAWRSLTLFSTVTERLLPGIVESDIWNRSSALRLGFAERYPAFAGFIRSRVNPGEAVGLVLTLTFFAAIYLAALFSGLTEEILESQGTIHFDNLIHALFKSWRVEPLTSIFGWITALGSSPAVVAAVIIATGFLWSQRRLWTIAPMWMSCLGAVASTSIGKFLIGRHRPPDELGIEAITSSFPSGHATVAMAVYGFLAYAIARNLPGTRERFEIAYWTGVLIVLVGFSRVFLGAHYLTDVIGGFLVGGFWLLAGFAVAEWGACRQTFPCGESQ